MLTIVDTFSRFSPALEPRFTFRGLDVVEVLERVGREVGLPATIRVDQGTEFVSRDLDLWAYQRGVTLDVSRLASPRTTRSSKRSTGASESISQDDLAYEAEISRSYLSQLEKGKYHASLKIIGKPADALSVDPAEFLVGPSSRVVRAKCQRAPSTWTTALWTAPRMGPANISAASILKQPPTTNLRSPVLKRASTYWRGRPWSLPMWAVVSTLGSAAALRWDPIHFNISRPPLRNCNSICCFRRRSRGAMSLNGSCPMSGSSGSPVTSATTMYANSSGSFAA